jgi:putative phosphoesterase
VKERIIGVISDTHGKFDSNLPRLFKACDHILHAGDIGDLCVLHQLEKLAPVTAILGNIDEGNLPPDFQLEQSLQLYGIHIFILHILGNPRHLNAPLRQKLEKMAPDVVIFGHSHRPLLEKIGSVLYLNPGSAGPRRFSLPRSVGLLKVRGPEFNAEIIQI